MPDYAYFVQMDIPTTGMPSSTAFTTPSTPNTSAKLPASTPATATGCSPPTPPGSPATPPCTPSTSPGVPYSDGWRVEGEKGDWATKIRPHATNRTHTMLKRIADAGDESADAGYIFIVQTDVAAEVEDEFNRLYDTVHLPGLCQVDGVVSARRYRVEATNLDGIQKYAAVYRIESPSVIDSEPWQAAVQDEWTAKVRDKCVGLTRTIMQQVTLHPAG